MPRQKAVALQLYIKEGLEDEMKVLIRKLGNPSNLDNPSLFSHKNFPEVHFMRWLVAPGIFLDGKKINASLIYSSNIDGSRSEHYMRMVEVTGDFLHDLFQLCEGYENASKDESGLLKFIHSHYVHTPAFYIGAPNRSVNRIINESKLHEAIARYVNGNNLDYESPATTIRSLRRWLSNEENRKLFALEEESSKTPRVYWIPAFSVILLSLVVLLVNSLFLYPLVHFFYERKLDPLGRDINQLDPDDIETKMAPENKVYQNQLSQVFVTKHGLRKLVLWINLHMTNLLARTIFVKGKLLGTPTIHFARWLMIDGGKRFVFFSNFDGSYDEYLGDFVDNSGWGLNAIYGAAKDYPTTKYVLGGGAYKIGQFLGWGRYCQVETQAWYAAYPNLGLEQIVNNSLLREGLERPVRNENKIKKLLRRI